MAARWYIVQAYSNFEKRVKETLEREAAEKGLDHLFEAVSYTHLTLPTILLV